MGTLSSKSCPFSYQQLEVYDASFTGMKLQRGRFDSIWVWAGLMGLPTDGLVIFRIQFWAVANLDSRRSLR